MRRIITWSVRGKNPWIVIAVWVIVAGALSMGPKLQSVTSNDASRSLATTIESKRADALQQASFPDAKGTPVIVVYSSDEPLTAADKAAIGAGEDWLRSGAEPVNSTRVRVLRRRQGRARLREPGRQPGRRVVPRLRAGHPRPLRRDRGGHAGARHRPRRPHHRRLQDLPQRRRQAARGHRAPRAGAAPAHLPLAGAAVRAAHRRRLRLLRRRRHPRAGRERARRHAVRAGDLADGDPAVRRRHRLRPAAHLALPRGPAPGERRPHRPGHRARRDVGGDRRQRSHRDAGGAHAALRPVRRLPLVRAGARRRRVRHPHRRAHAHAGAARPARPPRLLAAPAQARRRDAAHRTWERVADWVAAGPRRAARLVTAILVVLALGCLFYSPRFSFTEDFLTSMPSSEGYALLEQHFPKGALAPTTVLIEAAGRRRPSSSPA